MAFRSSLPYVAATFFLALLTCIPADAQERDLRSQRLVLDDDGNGGAVNTLTIEAPLLAGNRVLTIPDPGPAGGEFLLASGGSLGITEIETPNADETLRLNPSGDLVQVGNSAAPGTSNGLEIYGDMTVVGPDLSLSTMAPSTGVRLHGDTVDVGARYLNITVTETVTIDGNLVVTGDLDVQGRFRAYSSGNRIGSGANTTQLRIDGAGGGSADHLYVLGNVRLTDELRIGTGINTSIFQTGAQSGVITYTLPTSLPAAATSGTSMGNGVMQTDASGTMTWRNSGTASGSLDFASTADGATDDQTITLTGAAVGDMVILGTPGPTVGTWYEAWVSAAHTVTVRLHNESGGAVDPVGATFNVMVMRP